MSLASWTPCDEIGFDGRHHCPYCDDGDYVNCEYYCGADEPADDYDYDYEDDVDESFYDPYMGCDDYDCPTIDDYFGGCDW